MPGKWGISSKVNKFYGFWRDFLDIIYPKSLKCLFCGGELPKVNDFKLCSNCTSIMQLLPGSTCTTCGRPLGGKYKMGMCSECKDTEIYFDGACSVFEFSGIVQSALHRFKFEGEVDMAEAFGLYMAKKLKERKWKIDVILPVPLHEKRMSDRGYNQSYLLSAEIGRECGIDVLDGALIRKRHTESQVSLPKFGRIHNVKGAFAMVDSKCIKGKSVLIVDDIMTTGATLNECSRILRESGARNIYCITAACPFHTK